jgi:GNAT superfamily N-acetyltransferase
MIDIRIRPAILADIGTLQRIEIDATAALVDVGAIPSGDPRPMSLDALATFVAEHICIVAEAISFGLVGFVAARGIGADLYIAELDVLRSYQIAGIGRRLMLAILEEGTNRQFRSAILTTDRHAPFNRPFYEKLGFKMSEPPVPPLAGLLADEIRQGLDPARRVGMLRPLRAD